MAFLDRSEKSFLQTVSDTTYCNLFSPERLDYEKRLLERDYEELGTAWSLDIDDPDPTLFRPFSKSPEVTSDSIRIAGCAIH